MTGDLVFKKPDTCVFCLYDKMALSHGVRNDDIVPSWRSEGYSIAICGVHAPALSDLKLIMGLLGSWAPKACPELPIFKI